MINPLINTIILSLIPISELRGAIPYAISQDINIVTAFFVAVIANFLVIPIVFFFLDYLHKHFLEFDFYKKTFDKYINRNRKKIEKHIGTKTEFIALILVVATPLPFTGAYTGSILAWFFGLKRRKSYLAIILGIIIAGILVSLASLGILKLF